MRTHFSFLSVSIFAMLALAHFGFVSCGDDPTEPITYEVSPDKESLTFDYDSTETQTVSVTVTPAAEWSFETADEWIRCEKIDNTLKVSVLENSEILRRGAITIKVSESDKAKAGTATLTVVQEGAPGSPGTPVEPNVNITFEVAAGTYIGVSECGYTGEYTIELTKDDKTLTLVAFDELAPVPGRFLATAGAYQAAGTHDFHTFIVGSSNSEHTIVGTRYKYGSREVMVKEGSFNLTSDAGKYTLTAKMKGEDADYNQHEMEFSFTGEIPFTSDYEPEYIDLYGDVYASFYGDRNSEGISRYNLNITSREDGMGNYYAFKTKYLYSPLIDVNPVKDYLYIPSGVYKIQEEKTLFSMPPGYLAQENSELMNSFFLYANTNGGIKEAVLAEYGSMVLEYNSEDKTYEIYGHIAGKDLTTGETRDVPFKFIGSFPVSNMNASVEYKVMKNERNTPITINHHFDDAYPGLFNELIVYYFDDVSNPNNNVTLSFNIIVPLDYEYIPGELPEGTFEIGSYESPSAFSIIPGTKIGNMLRFSSLSITEKTGGYPMGHYLFKEGSITISKKEDGKYGIVGDVYGTSNTGKVSEIIIDINSAAINE